MADDLAALGGLDFNDLQNDSLWEPFEMDLTGEDFPGGDMLCHQFDVLSSTPGTAGGDAGVRKIPSNSIERGQSCENVSLDMNDQTVLGDYGTLFLFANSSSASYLKLEGYNPSRQATIQALAAKLDLEYSYDSSLGVIQLRKSSCDVTFSHHSQQTGAIQGLATPFISQFSSSSPQWKARSVGDARRGNLFNINEVPSFLNSSAAMDVDFTSKLNFGKLDPWGEEAGNYFLGTMQQQDISEDDEELSQASIRVTSSSQRRNSWIRLSRTLKDVGACWRCKILRKKCDIDQPCKACPRSSTNNSRWQAIGCKRGTLMDHMPYVSLCPGAAIGEVDVNKTFDVAQRGLKTPGGDRIEVCLQDAMNRLEVLFSSDKDSYTKIVLEILCSPLPIRTATPLSLRRDVEGNVIHIAWGLTDISPAKDILHINSLEHTLDVMKAAVTYELEYGLSQAVPIAIECFRNCIEILRLHVNGHLTTDLHSLCVAGNCQINPFRTLSSNIKTFADELSKVIFRKENRLHERRWWLSVFYSLWIQSHVRRTIMFVEHESKARLSLETKGACSTYLLLALELFDAASASFDPLTSAWSLEEEPLNMDLRLLKYYRLAQKALLSEQWAYDINSSIDYLRCLYHDRDPYPSKSPQGDMRLSSMSGLGSTDTEGHAAYNLKPSAFQSNRLAQSEDKFSVPLRTRSGAKRRAGSPLQDINLIRRNGSSSSMLSSKDIRSRGISIASPKSPMSSAYSFACGTSNSTVDSLAEMGRLPETSPPNPRDQFDYLSPSNGRVPSLHYKSSNESFLELPRTLNKRRPSSSTTKGGISNGFFLCECCPKKPKKFETMEELSAHEAEKQYECSFCGNRFKSKNEAERHRNSLHVRRHSWSCATLLSGDYYRAFHDSTNRPGEVDICGYCGDEFERRGGADHHRNELFRHLQDVHKFRECNLNKKFYRADHFRQHLKHSHAGTSGKWTNMLEMRCMADIPGPGDGN